VTASENSSAPPSATHYEQALTDATEIRGLTPAEKLVLLTLAARANAAHGQPVGVIPSDLADRLGYQRKTIAHALTKLEDAGYISRTPQSRPTPSGGTVRRGELVTFHYEVLRAARSTERTHR
jgi:DNA-binding IclR family transcriptional regulator